MHSLRLQRVRLTRGARRLLAVPLLGFGVLAGACGDPVDPEALVEGRAAHAIPGGVPALVLIDFVVQGQLEPLQNAAFLIRGLRHTYQFVLLEDTLSLDIEHERDLTALILMDLDGPTIRDYGMDFTTGDQRLAVVNAATDAGDLTVTLAAANATFDMVLAPGGSQTIEAPAGAFSVQVRGQSDDADVQLDPFSLFVGDHGFLVIVHGPGPDEPYAWMLF